ncbi:FBD-like protein [Tanacetum coccineum]
MPGNTEDFYFKAPNLKRLRLALLYYSSKDIHKVVLNVPNLEYLYIEESFVMCSLFVMEDFSSLVKAKVSCDLFYHHLWVELLKGLSKVRNLTLDLTRTNGDVFNLHFPEFPHVKKLAIVGCDPLQLWKIPQILERFCQLEHLCIKSLGKFDTQFLRFILEKAVDLKKLIVSKDLLLRGMSESDGAGVLRIPEMYKTDALASSWGCPKTKLRREDEQKDIPKGVCTLKTGSRETRNQEACLAVPDSLPESLSVIPPGDSSDACFGDLRRHVPPVLCDQMFR